MPAGVSGNWSSPTATISGTPTVSGTFTYTVTTTGGCGGTAATGTITVTPNNTITLTSAAGTNAQTKCINTAITNITYSTTGATGATVTGLPAGVSGNWSSPTATISGTPTVSGIFTYTVTTTGGCTTPAVTATGTITVTPNNTITLTSAAGTDAQTKCINTAITNITYSTTGATGATYSGLPTGVTGNWASNTVTINGTPTAAGTFTYTVTTTGGCTTPAVTATGTITVTPNNTITLTSAAGTDAQTKCINTAITNITYSTTGATGATYSGLPTGVTGNWASNTVTINGTPTAAGTFTYTVTTTGGCTTPAVTATGTITVTPNNTISLSSAVGTDAQTKCINTAITNITYSTTGATGATVTGLPAGVSGNWSSPTATISGTPTVSGTFTYTVKTTGGCGGTSAAGTITVTPNNTINLSSAVGTDAQTKCINTAITNITYSTTGATGATVTGLPAGVSGSWSSNMITINGIPSVSGTFAYSILLTGGCGTVSVTGTITVNPLPVVSITGNVSICVNFTTTLSPTTGGVWVSNNPPVASVTNAGLVTGLTAGSVTFTFTETSTACSNTTLPVTIIVCPPDINSPPDINQTADAGSCEAAIAPGFPALVSGTLPITYTWVMSGATSGSGTGPITPNPYFFHVGITTITWTATNSAGSDACVQTITITDNQAPSFTLPTLATGYCVEGFEQAIFHPGGVYYINDLYYMDGTTPARRDYYIFEANSTELDLTNINDNCGSSLLEISWSIDFGNNSSVDLSGTGQLSTYGEIHFPIGDNKISWTVTDSNGNTYSDNAILKVLPRPNLN